MELYAIDRNFATRYLETLENASIEERAAAFDRFGSQALPDIVSRVEGSNEAAITITGPLSPEGPSPIARYFGFGGTGYSSIISAAKALVADESIETVRLVMDTPGGTVAGMDPAWQALSELAASKKVIAENHGMIASAGYYLATAAPEIVAMSPLSETGSIGVIRAGFDFTEAMASMGIKRIKIVSSHAPNKQADPTTPEGRVVHQNDVDAVERVFIRKVAEGRGTTDADVIENFGKGGMLIAQDPDSDKPDAVSVGMIDSVITGDAVAAEAGTGEDIGASNSATGGDDVVPEAIAAEGGGQNEEAILMDLKQLRAEHPALYAEAVEAGVNQERDRVTTHIDLGKAAGDLDLAVSCITDGVEHTAASNGKYLAVQMTNNAIAARATESEGDLNVEAAAAETLEADVAKALAAELGVENNG